MLGNQTNFSEYYSSDIKLSYSTYLFTSKVGNGDKRAGRTTCWRKCCGESLNSLVVGCQRCVDANAELHTLQRDIVVIGVKLALDVCDGILMTLASDDAIFAWRVVCDFLQGFCAGEEVVDVE
jgi:hypothetical protein